MKISAIVLASGLSRRMGQNKLLMTLGNKTIVENVLETVRFVEVHEKLLVANDAKIISFGGDYGFKTIYNENPDVGQSASVKLGVLNADRQSSYMFFVADQPLITAQMIEELILAHTNCPDNITVPTHDGKNGSPVIFPNSFRNSLLDLRHDKGGRGLIEENPDKVNFVEFNDGKLFCDIDTPDDYLAVNI